MKPFDRRKSLLIGVGRSELPWWWRHVRHERLKCRLDYWYLPLAGARPRSPFSIGFVTLVVRAVRLLSRARYEGYDYVFTFENDWLTFILAGFQTLFGQRRPRHVILQFIMREKTASLQSRLKYLFLRWCYRSVYLSVCSSRPEIRYYRGVFGWPETKVAFVPFHTDPAFAERPVVPEENFVLAAGRTFRDYPTLLAASARGWPLPLTIVAGRGTVTETELPHGVSVRCDVPLPELIDLISRCSMMVLPLQEREISTGQSVLLEAMAMGKAVISSRVHGTVDYVEHMQTGILVPANDPDAIRDAVQLLAENPGLRYRLGAAAKERVLRHYLPDHYARGVSAALEARW